MKKSEKRLLDALSKIAEVANAAVGNSGSPDQDSYEENQDSNEEKGADGASEPGHAGCTIKPLPERLQAKAAEVAMKVNPVNAPAFGFLSEAAAAAFPDPSFLTLLTSKYWGPAPRRFTVSFMESTPADLRARILSHMNAWNRTTGISFVQTSGIGQVRISRRAGGYWSYLGTDVLLIPKNKPTMNLQGFSMSMPESEFKRVIRHETGHTLGFPHEHMRQELVDRIVPAKAYAYFLRTQGWNKATVDAQVLTPLNVRSIIGTSADQTSIMCYQLPGEITRDGRPITGGVDINTSDFAFAGRIYPKPGKPGLSVVPEQQQEEWDETEDVPDDQILADLEASATNQDDTTGQDDQNLKAKEYIPDPNGVKA